MKRVAAGIVFVCALAGCGTSNIKPEEIDLESETGTGGDGGGGDGTNGDGTNGDDSSPPEFDIGSGNDDTGGSSDGSTDDTGAADTYVPPADTLCAATEIAAIKPPVDIIFTIDQSESMSAEIVQVKQNINKLATYLAATGLDYRVIMIAAFTPPSGNAYKVCVPPPLGGATCTSNSATLRLVNRYIYSTDSLTWILNTYPENPPSDRAWKDFLRPDALKVFVPVTDDHANMTAATFDAELLKLPGGQFGTAAKRNYTFYGIIGSNQYPATTLCTGAVRAGSQYHALANLTNGRWYPVCDLDYGPIFAEMGKNIAATVACEVTIPAPPPGETFDPNRVNVIYTPSTGGTVNIVKDDANACALANGWQVSVDGTKILLCGTACSGLQADPGGKVSIQFGCAGQPPPPPPDAGTCTPFGAACGDADRCCEPLVCLPGADGSSICRAKPPS